MAFEELKQRHAAMWGSAPFEQIAGTLADMHEAIIGRVAPGPADTMLDVGCGTGELAIMAARTGAEVVGSDLAPVLVETARRQAAEQGLSIGFDVADCEALPYGDASFDIVTSTLGAIFAPDQPRAASELARVCRAGGRLGMTAWRPDGEMKQFFGIIAAYAPPPVEGAGNSMSWGDRDHVQGLLGNSFDLEFEDGNTPWAAPSALDTWTQMAEAFGPIKTLLTRLEPERAAAFREEMLDYMGTTETEDGVVLDRPYLLISGTRRVP